jgi:hypothetical protein
MVGPQLRHHSLPDPHHHPESDIPEFRNLETHGDYSSEEFNRFETMIAEASR